MIFLAISYSDSYLVGIIFVSEAIFCADEENREPDYHNVAGLPGLDSSSRLAMNIRGADPGF